MQKEVNTIHFDRRIEARSQEMATLAQLKKAGITYHPEFCSEKIKSVGHALIAAKADILRAENSKMLFQQGIPFGVSISAGNRNATEIVEINPMEHELHGTIVTQDEKKDFYVCVDGKVVNTSEYFVFLSKGEYSLVKLTGTL